MQKKQGSARRYYNEADMNLKKGFFRLTLAGSLCIGLVIAILSFFEEIDSAQFSLAEKITLNLPIADISTNPTYEEQLLYNELKETGMSDKDLAAQGLDVSKLQQNSSTAVENAFNKRRRQIYDEQTGWGTLKDNPGIILAVFKMTLLWFAAVWILYYTLYFIIAGFTAKNRGKGCW